MRRRLNLGLISAFSSLVLDPVAAVCAAGMGIIFPAQAPQGSMVICKVPSNSRVLYGDRQLDVTAYGTVVFGVARDARGPVHVQVTPPGGSSESVAIDVQPRDWPIERVNGVPPKTVSPPPAIAERIRREQARVARARFQ